MNIKHILILIFITIALYGATLSYDFVWDDEILLLGNSAVLDFDIQKILFSPTRNIEYYPLRELSYAIDYLIWGKNPLGFHLTSLLLYILNVVFVYLLTIKLVLYFRIAPKERAGIIAFLAGLLFAVLPIHVEPVSFIICRNYLLVGAFMFSSTRFFVRFLENGALRDYIFAFVLFVLGLFSKETATTLPFMYLFLAIWRRQKSAIIKVVPFFIVAFSALWLFKSIAEQGGRISGLPTVTEAVFRIPLFYFIKIFLPTGYMAEYTQRFDGTVFSLRAIISAAWLAGVFVLGYVLRKRHTEILFGQYWFFVSLLPYLNFYMTEPAVANRYAYVASFGYVFMVSALLGRALWYFMQGRALRPVLAGLVAVLFTVSFYYSLPWKSNKALWEREIKNKDATFKAYSNLADIALKEGDSRKALDYLRRVDAMRPGYVTVEYLEALQKFKAGQYSDTIRILSSALQFKKELFGAKYLLGQAYEKTGDIYNAADLYYTALRSRSTLNVMKRDEITAALKRVQRAAQKEIAPLKDAVSKNPSDPRAIGSLALALHRAAMYNEALELYLRLEAIMPDNFGLYLNMASAYGRLGKINEAIKYYEKALHLNKDPNALIRLAAIYVESERWADAIRTYKDAIEADPKSSHAPFNLALVYYQRGDYKNADKYFRYVMERFPELSPVVEPYLTRIAKQD